MANNFFNQNDLNPVYNKYVSKLSALKRKTKRVGGFKNYLKQKQIRGFSAMDFISEFNKDLDPRYLAKKKNERRTLGGQILKQLTGLGVALNTGGNVKFLTNEFMPNVKGKKLISATGAGIGYLAGRKMYNYGRDFVNKRRMRKAEKAYAASSPLQKLKYAQQNYRRDRIQSVL